VFIRSFLPWFVLATSALVACAKQSEGERCDNQNAGNDDCASGLVCTPALQLQDQSADRCCPKSERSSDPRCQGPQNVGTGGSGGTGGTGGGGSGGDGSVNDVSSEATDAQEGGGGTGGTAGNGGTAGAAGDDAGDAASDGEPSDAAQE
jgi:hypothetical protein